MPHNKIKSCLSIGAGLAVIGLSQISFSQQIQVVVNGKPIAFLGRGPKMIADRVMVPLRGVFEQMGAKVDWNPNTQTIVARRGATTVTLTIGRGTALVNSDPVTLDVPAAVLNGRTLVPLRFVGEALGGHVKWLASTETVSISGGNYEVSATQAESRAQRVADSSNSITLRAATVIPATLTNPLGSDISNPGQAFTATLTNYPGLPDGCTVEGTVKDVMAANQTQSGAIELSFNAIVTPTGKRYPIVGSAVPLNDPNVAPRSDGRMEAIAGAISSRYVFAEVGGNPTVIMIASNQPLHSERSLREINRKVPAAPAGYDVEVSTDTKFGIRLKNRLSIE